MTYQRILVPIDGSPTSKRALEEAIALASEQNGRVRIIHVIDNRQLYMPDGVYPSQTGDAGLRKAGEWLLAQAAAEAQQKEITSETALLESVDEPIAQRIVNEGGTWGADLIVLGTHGRHGVERLMLGSVAERVARLATVPVLLVHGK